MSKGMVICFNEVCFKRIHSWVRLPGNRPLYTDPCLFGRNDHREDEPHFTNTIICPLARYSKHIKECLSMIYLEMELKETAHKKTISEHNIEQARLLSNLEEKENNLNITKKDLDRITRERVRQIYITHQNNFFSFRLN